MERIMEVVVLGGGVIGVNAAYTGRRQDIDPVRVGTDRHHPPPRMQWRPRLAA
jgi:glycine/D-amino acid oxidase-like deaminating enzyme